MGTFKRYIIKLFQVAGVRVETDLTRVLDDDFVVISRGNNGSDTNRRLINDEQFFVPWNKFVQFLQGATTDKFVQSVALSGRMLVLTYNNGDPDITVDLDPLGTATAFTLTGSNLNIERSGTAPTLTVDLDDYAGLALINPSLGGNALEFNTLAGGSASVNLQSLQIDGLITAVDIVGTEIQFTRFNDVPFIVDIASLQDGVVNAASLSGNDLVLSRSAGLSDVVVDLTPVLTQGVVQEFSNDFNRAQLDAMSPTNRLGLFGGALTVPFIITGYAVRLLEGSGSAVYANNINLVLSHGPVTGGVDLGSLSDWSFQASAFSFSGVAGQNLQYTGSNILRVHHGQNLGGDPGDYSVRVNITYVLIS